MSAQLKVIETDRSAAMMDREKALEAALAQIDRAFGKGSAMKLGARQTMEIEAVSTGSLGLDIALGIGGVAAVQAATLDTRLTALDVGQGDAILVEA